MPSDEELARKDGPPEDRIANGAEQVQIGKDVTRAHVEFFEGDDGDWYWRVQAPNGRFVAIGGEAFGSEGEAIRAFNTAYQNVTEAHNDFAYPVA
jgi:uncharacterized protein YegP (UPF0339 family)